MAMMRLSNISVAKASLTEFQLGTSTTDGYLLKADASGNGTWQAAGYEPILTKGDLTETTSSVLTIENGANSVIGSGTTIQVKQASGYQSGYLSSIDWNTFNNKQDNIGITGLADSASVIGTSSAGSATTVSRGDHVHALPNSGIVAGTYKSLTVNAAGIVTGGTNPTTIAEYGITDAASTSSPTFTGTPTAPTALVNTNTNQLATTAFVLGQASSTTPNMDGIASIGTKTTFARADHIHPSDNSKLSLSGGTMTGEITFNDDGEGITLFGGGRIYKKSGTGLIIKRNNGDIDPQIENYAGTATYKIWHEGNDGSGSGLDADTVNGLYIGNLNGNIPTSNGSINTNLNADMVDGKHAGTAAGNILVLDENGLVPAANLPATSEKTGTTNITFEIDSSNNGPKLKNNAGVLEIRNASDTDYADLTVNNINIKGSLNEINTTQVNVSDNTFILNSSYVGSSPSANAGFQVNRSTAINGNASLLWNEASGIWMAGYLGTEKAMVLTNDGRLANLSGTGTLGWTNLTGIPNSFNPSAHVTTHKTGGSDAMAPGDIGALALTGGTLTGKLWVNVGGNGFALQPGNTDQTYMEFYARTTTPTTRSGFFGYGNTGATTLTLANEISNGNINIITTGTGAVFANSNRILTVADEGSTKGLDADTVDSYHAGNASGNVAINNGTVNTNLNADTVDGLHASAFPLKDDAIAGTIHVYEQVAAYNNDAASQVGTLKITMPKGWTNTMLNIVIKGYDYSANGGYELILGGYNFASTPVWTNCTATTNGAVPFSSIRFAYDGTNCCILLGTTATTWQYPTIYVDKVIAGHNNSSGWGTGWAIALITSETGITNITTTTINAGLNSDTVDGYHAGNASGQIPVSNGTVNTNLNADMIDGNHATAFLLSSNTSTQIVSSSDVRVQSTSSTERFSMQYNYNEGSLDFIYFPS